MGLKNASFVLDYSPLQPSINQRKESGQMKKFDRATVERVLAARQEGKTLKEISSETGVCLTLVKKWLKEAAAKNDEGIQIRRYDTQAERKKILAEYAENHSPKKICAKYHIVKSTLFRWKRQKKVIATSQAGTVYTAGKLHKMKRELTNPSRNPPEM